jgi:methylase of polypeptide subunit release factors
VGDEDAALLDLLRHLDQLGYAFVTPTPATHARVISRPARRTALSLTDVLGWSLPFSAGVLDPHTEELLNAAGMIRQGRCKLRVSKLHDRLYLHSAFPTDAQDAVFFGPDSYRFADLILCEGERLRRPPRRIVDIGTGAGVGAIVAASLNPDAEIIATDINPLALRFGKLNARHAGISVEFIEAEHLSSLDGAFDLIVANPPYILDDAGRSYRDGGEMHGAAVSIAIARMAVARLADEGSFLLYTGSAIIDGEDRLKTTLWRVADDAGCLLHYHEIDPDVFGDELESESYRDVDRIAVVVALFTKN